MNCIACCETCHQTVHKLITSLHSKCYRPSAKFLSRSKQHTDHCKVQSHDSAVGITIANELDDGGVRVLSPGRVKSFLFSVSSKLALESTQPPIQWVPVDLSPGVKRLGREADQSLPTSVKVKKTWNYTSTPHMSSRCSS
jgi:hypothetical protein